MRLPSRTNGTQIRLAALSWDRKAQYRTQTSRAFCYNSVHPDTVQFSTLHYGKTQVGTVQPDTVHVGIAQVGTMQSGIMQVGNQMRILGRWMRMITIPNQSSVAKAWQEFDEDGRMKPSSYYDRIVDVMEELVKFTLLTRGNSAYLVDRYSERKESAEELSRRVNQSKI